MSILIKALKQAERDHMARSAAPAMASTAVDEAEPPPVMVAVPASLPPARHSTALSLEPVDAPGGGADTPTDAAAPFGGDPSTPETPEAGNANENRAAQPGAATVVESPPPAAAPNASRGPPRVVAAVLPTSQSVTGAARVGPSTNAPAAILPADEPTAADARAGKTAPPPPEAQARQRAGATPEGPAESGATAEALQSERRKAARQLMAPAPRSGRVRPVVVVGSIAVLIAGGLGAAAWFGLFSGLDGLLTAPMPPAPAYRSLADRLAVAPAPASAMAAAHKPGSTPAPPAKAENRVVDAPGRVQAPPPPMAGAPASGDDRGGAPRPRAADAIHLRPPEAAPERLRGLLQEAYGASGRGDTAGAARIYQQVIDLDHNNGDAWIGLAALAANGGDSAAANRDYRRALEIDPGDSVALGGLLGLQTGVDAQEAETRLRLLIVHDGAQPALQAALGKMLAHQGRWLEAQETFYQAWAADPTQPDVAFNLAVTLERIRQPLPALSFYRRALELAQTHSVRFNPAVAQERVAALTPKQP